MQCLQKQEAAPGDGLRLRSELISISKQLRLAGGELGSASRGLSSSDEGPLF